MIPKNYVFVIDHCEDCNAEFNRQQYDLHTVRCQSCSQIYELRRIADVLEYWVGMQ